MELAVTLLADPDLLPLSEEWADTMADSLGAQATRWLAEGVAFDFTLEADDVQSVEMTVREMALGRACDVVVQPAAGRRRKLLISDMDSTMITIECIDELADFVGCKPQVAEITERAMNGELDFAAALEARVALLKGLPESVLQQAYDERVVFTLGARELVGTMKAAGATCVLVSGGFTFFTSRVAAQLGFGFHSANTLEIENARLTGRVMPPILGKEAKLSVLQQTCEQIGIGTQDVLAVGDGANDLPMLLAAGMGVAYRARPLVQARAAYRLNYADLSGLLYAQGYTQDEIVTDSSFSAIPPIAEGDSLADSAPE